MKAVWGIVSLFIVLPIWFYLLHEILELVAATDLMWFLYWAYVPVALLMGIIGKLLEPELGD